MGGFIEDIEKFKNREIKAKDIFIIGDITKPMAYEVFDNRYNEWYTCPICTGKLRRIYKDSGGNTIGIECDEEENKYNVVDLF